MRNGRVADPETRRQEFEEKMRATGAALAASRLQIKQKSYATILQEMLRLEEEQSQCDPPREPLRIIKRDI